MSKNLVLTAFLLLVSNAFVKADVFNRWLRNGKKAPAKESLGVALPKVLKRIRSKREETFLKSRRRKSASRGGSKLFSPQRDDLAWPGTFPVLGSGDDLVLNIMPDSYPTEMIINVRVVDPVIQGEETTRSYVVSEDLQGNQTLKWLPLSGFRSQTLYSIEIVDTKGDGICCEFGKGWVTVTDQSRNILWDIRGDYGRVAAMYLWLDKDEVFEIVGQITGSVPNSNLPGGVGSAVGDGFIGNASVIGSENESDGPDPPSTTEEFECQFCPGSSSVGAPFKKTTPLDGGSTTCREIEELFSSYDRITCQVVEASGLKDAHRRFCECPGFEHHCTFCPGGASVGSPSKVFQFNDGTSLTCDQMEASFAYLAAADCAALDLYGQNAHEMAAFCGCPGVTGNVPNNAVDGYGPNGAGFYCFEDTVTYSGFYCYHQQIPYFRGFSPTHALFAKCSRGDFHTFRYDECQCAIGIPDPQGNVHFCQGCIAGIGAVTAFDCSNLLTGNCVGMTVYGQCISSFTASNSIDYDYYEFASTVSSMNHNTIMGMLSAWNW